MEIISHRFKPCVLSTLHKNYCAALVSLWGGGVHSYHSFQPALFLPLPSGHSQSFSLRVFLFPSPPGFWTEAHFWPRSVSNVGWVAPPRFTSSLYTSPAVICRFRSFSQGSESDGARNSGVCIGAGTHWGHSRTAGTFSRNTFWHLYLPVRAVRLINFKSKSDLFVKMMFKKKEKKERKILKLIFLSYPSGLCVFLQNVKVSHFIKSLLFKMIENPPPFFLKWCLVKDSSAGHLIHSEIDLCLHLRFSLHSQIRELRLCL